MIERYCFYRSGELMPDPEGGLVMFSAHQSIVENLQQQHKTTLLEKIIEIDKLKAEIRRMRPAAERDSWSRNPGQGCL